MFACELTDDRLAAGEFNQQTSEVVGAPATGRDHVHVLPAVLEEMAPGPFLGSILSVVDPEKLVGRDVVRYVQAQARLVAHYQAAYYTGISELAHAVEADTTQRAPVPNEYATDELAAALTQTRRAAQTDIELALDLHQRLPEVTAALAEGRIDVAKARVFTQETLTLKAELIPTVVAAVIGHAPELTTGQLRARLKKAVLAADQQAAQTQYEAGLQDRKLVVYPNPDHTATLSLLSVDPVQAVAATRHIHQLALQLKRLPGETRTIDQLKTDIALDLLQGKTTNTNTNTNTDTNHTDTPHPIVVHISSDTPTGHITGYGPILTTTAQSTPTGTGTNPITTDCHHTNSRKPTKTQTQHVISRYPTCIHPGCRIPATRCDLDHRRPWHQNGKTTCTNLAPLCRHHHQCKTKGGWKLKRNPDGSHTHTSPLGHTYTTGKPP